MTYNEPVRNSYSEKEAEEILRRAANAESPEVSRDQLLATAAELGISPLKLHEAEVAYLAEKRQKQDFARRSVAARKDFLIHFFVYCIVNGGLALIDLLENGHIDFVFFPMIAWGIGLAIHAYSAFFIQAQAEEPEPQLLTDQDQLFRLVSREESAEKTLSTSR